MSTKRDLEFLYEVGCLRFIPRMWQRYLNPDFENLAEHHVRVIWIALLIAKHEGVKDTGLIAKMALVHDIAESRTGDVDDLSRQYTERNEQLGIEDMLASTALEEEFIKLWHDYEIRETIEAKIVKDADNLAVDFEIQEQKARGMTLADRLSGNRKVIYENKLYTKTAKKIWKALQESSPHDWHRNGRTRLNAGDWKIT